MILHLLVRVLRRLGDRAAATAEWLKRPAPRGQVIVNAIGVLVLVAILSNYLIDRSSARDNQTRRQDQAICTILVALGPASHLPPTFRAPYMRSFADADCAQF